MKAKHSRLLVVDASVAQSAGETEHPVSRSCRQALVSMRDICHRVVMTEAIQEQWHDHATYFASKWLAGMYARKKVYRCEGVQLKRLDEACKRLSAGEQESLQEDLCLIEGACAGDGIILTEDEEIVRIWQKCQDRFGLSKPIRWINPVTDGIQPLECL